MLRVLTQEFEMYIRAKQVRLEHAAEQVGTVSCITPLEFCSCKATAVAEASSHFLQVPHY